MAGWRGPQPATPVGGRLTIWVIFGEMLRVYPSEFARDTRRVAWPAAVYEALQRSRANSLGEPLTGLLKSPLFASFHPSEAAERIAMMNHIDRDALGRLGYTLHHVLQTHVNSDLWQEGIRCSWGDRHSQT